MTIPSEHAIQEQDRVFDLVQERLRHWQQTEPVLKFPSVHLHLLNACLVQLGMQTRIAGWSLTEKLLQSNGKRKGDRTAGYVLGVEFPGGHVINHQGQRGWKRSMQECSRNNPEVVLGSNGHWRPIEYQIANIMVLQMMVREAPSVVPHSLTKIIGVVVAEVQQHELHEKTHVAAHISASRPYRL